MSSDPPASRAATALSVAAPSGKLAVLTAYAVAATAIPLPFLPDKVLERIRGAIVHDVGARHALSFTKDARALLASPATSQRASLVRAAESVARQIVKRFVAPIGVFSYAANAVDVFALGLLLERYMVSVRPHGSVRMQVEEATALRAVINKSVLRAASPNLHAQGTTVPKLSDDMRDELTRWIDGALLASATVPSWLEGRLEAAFDEIVAETPGSAVADVPDAPDLADAADARAALAKARRVVVKIGSKSLAQDAGADDDAWARLARDVARVREGGRHVVIVSSGAIALGVQKLGLLKRPKDMPWLQAAAAAGQSVLMQRYEDAFAKQGMKVAQVLLTHADLADRARTNNARSALAALLEARAVPIINENDAVAVDEIKFGDNDQLASMVTPLCDADLLLLLSDVEGLLDEEKRRVPWVRSVAREARHLAGASTSGVGTGGMASKVEAARRATYAGAHVVIASARQDDVVSRVLAGEDIGTLFVAVPQRLSARKHWIAYTLRPRGAVLVDRGAADAITQKNRSVLAVGVIGVRGAFAPGDAVLVLSPDGAEIARGLSRLSAGEAARVATKRREEGEEELVVIHKDDLVLLPADDA